MSDFFVILVLKTEKQIKKCTFESSKFQGLFIIYGT